MRVDSLIVTVFLSPIIDFASCTEELTPRGHYETPFLIYGVLTPQHDTRSVRVCAIEYFPTLGSPELLDVVLILTDMMTCEILTWKQTVT